MLWYHTQGIHCSSVNCQSPLSHGISRTLLLQPHSYNWTLRLALSINANLSVAHGSSRICHNWHEPGNLHTLLELHPPFPADSASQDQCGHFPGANHPRRRRCAARKCRRNSHPTRQSASAIRRPNSRHSSRPSRCDGNEWSKPRGSSPIEVQDRGACRLRIVWLQRYRTPRPDRLLV